MLTQCPVRRVNCKHPSLIHISSSSRHSIIHRHQSVQLNELLQQMLWQLRTQLTLAQHHITDWLTARLTVHAGHNSALSTTFPRSIPATFYLTAHSLKHRHKLTALNYWISRTFNDISHQIPKLSRPYSVFKDFPGPGKMDAFSFEFQRSVATQTITNHTKSRVSIFSCGLRVSSRSRLFPPSVPATWDPAHNGIHLLLCLAATENT